jgi:hypothetical protein
MALWQHQFFIQVEFALFFWSKTEKRIHNLCEGNLGEKQPQFFYPAKCLYADYTLNVEVIYIT